MSELRFTEDHEWLRTEADGSCYRIGAPVHRQPKTCIEFTPAERIRYTPSTPILRKALILLDFSMPQRLYRFRYTALNLSAPIAAQAIDK